MVQNWCDDHPSWLELTQVMKVTISAKMENTIYKYLCMVLSSQTLRTETRGLEGDTPKVPTVVRLKV